MSGIAAAAITGGAALIGGYMQSRGARKAADTSRQTTEQQLQYFREAEDRARSDIERLYPQAMDVQNRGFQQQLDLQRQMFPMTLDVFQQGNLGAQNVLAQSAPQQANAILGGPIDYSFMQPAGINYDISGVLAGLPNIQQQAQQYQPAVGPQPTTGPSYYLGGGGGGGYRVQDLINFGNYIGGPTPSTRRV